MRKNEYHVISSDPASLITAIHVVYSANNIQERLIRARKMILEQFQFMWYDRYYANVTFVAQSDMIPNIVDWVKNHIPLSHCSEEMWTIRSPEYSIGHVQIQVMNEADLNILKEKWIP